MRYWIVGLLVLVANKGNAQDLNPEEVIQQVYNILAGTDTSAANPDIALLGKGAWEALSYLEENAGMGIETLNEAVPDYYHFKPNVLILKLIDTQNQNEYGMELEVQYRLTDDLIVELLDPKTRKVKDRWKIMYLDENYLALDMGDLRLFFTHTPDLE